jgi:hypothetical protein
MPFASVTDFLDQHQGAVTTVLTVVLLGVTFFYAWQNRKMVKEMQQARYATILPKLALEFHRLGPMVVDLAIRNVGPGAALDIDVEVEWVPAHASDSIKGVAWRRNLLSPGEQIELFPPGDLNGNIDTLPETYKEIRLHGTMVDAGGREHLVDESFGKLAEWREVIGDARESWKPPQPEKRAADALYQKFERPLKDITSAVNSVAVALRGATQNDD